MSSFYHAMDSRSDCCVYVFLLSLRQIVLMPHHECVTRISVAWNGLACWP